MNCKKLFALAAAALLSCGLYAEELSVTELPEGARVGKIAEKAKLRIAGGAFEYVSFPAELKDLAIIAVPRGDGKKAAAAYSFTVNQPVTAYLLLQDRGKPELPEGWTKLDTEDKVVWKLGANTFRDTVYVKSFPAGKVEIPGHNGVQGTNYGVPNAVVLKPAS